MSLLEPIRMTATTQRLPAFDTERFVLTPLAPAKLREPAKILLKDEGIDLEVLCASQFWDHGIADEVSEPVAEWLEDSADAQINVAH